MKLRLNLSTTPQPNNRPFLAAAALFGTLGLIALAVLSLSAYRSWQANRSLRADIEHWQQEILADRERQQALEAYFAVHLTGATHSGPLRGVFELPYR